MPGENRDGDLLLPDMRSKDAGAQRFAHLPRYRFAGQTFPIATDRTSRLLGLAWLDRDRAGPGLLIPRCRSVHSFGMRFPLRLLFLGPGMRTVRCVEHLPPARICFCPAAEAVLEIVPREDGS